MLPNDVALIVSTCPRLCRILGSEAIIEILVERKQFIG